MGVPGIEAEHVTLVLENASPRTEIQLLRYRHPQAVSDPNIGDLHKLGFNHVCFAVDDTVRSPSSGRTAFASRSLRSGAISSRVKREPWPWRWEPNDPVGRPNLVIRHIRKTR
jgi:hypothetical protein